MASNLFLEGLQRKGATSVKRETVQQLHAAFEAIVKTEQETGLEFWLARELQGVLGYDRWENFAKVLEKAVVACKTAGFEPRDHFLESRKMVQLGLGRAAGNHRPTSTSAKMT